MAYRLKKSESVAEGIERIVLEEIDSATEKLLATGERDEAIHEARKSLKKIRGAVRLVQPELGRTYQRENAQLAAIGHKLSELRDSTAIIEAFEGLLNRHKNSLREEALGSIRQALERSKRETEQQTDLKKTVGYAITALRAMRKRVNSWPLNSDGFGALAPGLKERYRRGRRAMALTIRQQTPESHHEWRKRVKDHWYQLRLLENIWTDVLQAREQSLKELETSLGDDHNLVVLCEKVAQNPTFFGDAADVRLFLALATQYGTELRGNALSLGDRLYQEKPTHFVQSLSKLWDAWQAEPKDQKEVNSDRPLPPRRPSKAEPLKAKKRSAAA